MHHFCCQTEQDRPRFLSSSRHRQLHMFYDQSQSRLEIVASLISQSVASPNFSVQLELRPEPTFRQAEFPYADNTRRVQYILTHESSAPILLREQSCSLERAWSASHIGALDRRTFTESLNAKQNTELCPASYPLNEPVDQIGNQQEYDNHCNHCSTASRTAFNRIYRETAHGFLL